VSEVTSYNPLPLKHWRHNWKSAQVVTGQLSPSVWPHNPATRFRPPSATVVSAEPFLHGTGTLRCLQKEMATYRHWSVSLWRELDDVSHCRIPSPDKTEWWFILATVCRWSRCFVADQLWVMTHIQEEEDWSVIMKLTIVQQLWNAYVNLNWFSCSTNTTVCRSLLYVPTQFQNWKKFSQTFKYVGKYTMNVSAHCLERLTRGPVKSVKTYLVLDSFWI